MTGTGVRDELRRRIDAADDAILSALKGRFALMEEMRELKAREGLPGKDGEREKEILSRVAAAVEPRWRDTACGVWERILSGSRGEIETIARGACAADGKVLLCRARGSKTTYLPGGHIEFGETGAEALAREMMEEAGVEVEVGSLLGVVENSFLQHGERHCEINLVYEMKLRGGCAAVRQVESQEEWIEFEWRDVADLASANLLPAEMERFARGCKDLV